MENAECADKLCNGRRQRQLLHCQAKYLSNAFSTHLQNYRRHSKYFLVDKETNFFSTFKK
jgi:hypothetical protein